MIAPFKPRNTEHGILFTGPMVAAILWGQKRVTRRTSAVWAKRRVGDTLWVRETWNVGEWRHRGEGPGCWLDPLPAIPTEAPTDPYVQLVYAADGIGGCDDRPAYRPSIHMPRWASRLTLRITSLDEEPGIRCGRAGGPFLRHLCCSSSCRYTWACEQLPAVTDAEARLEGVADRAAYLQLWTEINGSPEAGERPAPHPETLWRIGFEVIDAHR